MKKSFAAAITFSLVILSAIGLQFVEAAKANPYIGRDIPPPADSKPLEITVLSPQNNSAHSSNSLFFEFNVSESPFNIYSMHIDQVFYEADWQTGKTTVLDFYDPSPRKEQLNYTSNLTGITEGKHSITINATGTFWKIEGIYSNYFMLNSSTTVNFTVDKTPPTISIMSPQNNTYYDPMPVPVIFTVSEPTSWIGYSTDDRENVTLAGNTSLTLINAGRIVLYANDTAGNMGKSETVFFIVGPTPYYPTNPPSSFPASSESSSESPTQTPSPTVQIPFVDPPDTTRSYIFYTILILATIVATGLLVYFAKRRRVKQ